MHKLTGIKDTKVNNLILFSVLLACIDRGLAIAYTATASFATDILFYESFVFIIGKSAIHMFMAVFYFFYHPESPKLSLRLKYFFYYMLGAETNYFVISHKTFETQYSADNDFPLITNKVFCLIHCAFFCMPYLFVCCINSGAEGWSVISYLTVIALGLDLVYNIYYYLQLLENNDDYELVFQEMVEKNRIQ